MPTEVDRAAYRIVQEALNNVVRHAGPATASVSIDRTSTALTVRVDDDGRATHMVISPTTAKTHVSRAMTELHARDRAQLVVYAYEPGLVSPRGPDGTSR